MMLPMAPSGLGRPIIAPPKIVPFQVLVFRLARFGYVLTASPARYGVKSPHSCLRKSTRWGFLPTQNTSGKLEPATSVLTLVLSSLRVVMSILRFTLRRLLSPCNIGFWTAGVYGGQPEP